MNFISNIINSGCAITCFFGNEDNANSGNNNNSKGKLKIVVNENYHIPEYLDTKTTLLLSVLVTKFMKEVTDPFNFDHETFKGEIWINNNRFEVILPPIIHDKFYVGPDDNIEDNQVGSDDYNRYQNDVLNYILEILKNYNDAELESQFDNLKNMRTNTHIINSLRGNVRYEVGIGKIFKSRDN